MLALAVALVAHFFEPFPNGWDQAEYVWCVKAGYLPHSPYVLFVALGWLLGLLMPPAVALSTLSAASGLSALCLLALLTKRLSGEDGDRWCGPSAALLLAVSPIFVRHAATQEVYALQLALGLTAALVLSGTGGRRFALAGAVTGAAVAVHYGSLFLLPALALLVARGVSHEAPPHGKTYVRRLLAFAAGAAVVLLVAAGAVAVVIPAEPGARIAETLGYLRGMAPGVEPALGGVPASAALGLLERLVSSDVPVTRGPLATGPVGASLGLAAAALAGAAWAARRAPRAVFFWLLWAGPYLAYELSLGWNLDYGIYLVFVLPPLCALAAQAVGWLAHRPRPRAALGAAALLALLAVWTTLPLARHWGDPALDRERHASPATLAAIWAAESLPHDAVVVQPRGEWNSNLLPLYADRVHVARAGAALRLFQSRGPFTPMRPEAYQLLDTALLTALLRAGRHVYAFEPEPLRGSNPGRLDGQRFRWSREGEIDLSELARRHGYADAARRHAGRRLSFYRASLRTGERGARPDLPVLPPAG